MTATPTAARTPLRTPTARAQGDDNRTRAARALVHRCLRRDDIGGVAAALDLLGGDARTRAARRCALAAQLVERGRPDAALALWRSTADLLLLAGEPGRAATVCRRALTVSPEAADWSLRLVRILVDGGRLTEALAALRAAPIPASEFEARLMAGMLTRLERRLAAPSARAA